jgi:hypothetical protein
MHATGCNERIDQAVAVEVHKCCTMHVDPSRARPREVCTIFELDI